MLCTDVGSMTLPSAKRMSIYRALAIPEVWQYTKRGGVIIYHLTKSEYIENSASLAFPSLTVIQLNQFLDNYQNNIQLAREVRGWVAASAAIK